jgi:chloramphenicol 3-O-phosphotransferase
VTQILFIIGAPAVGKTSTARAVAARFPRSIHIPVDDIRDMVVSGLVYPGAWIPSLVEQLRLARQSVIQIARIYRSAGFTVVVDDFWDPNSQLEEYHELFSEPDVHNILLYPSQLTAEARLVQRSGSLYGNEYIAHGIQAVYEHLNNNVHNLIEQGWLVLDTTDQTVDETANLIMTKYWDNCK